MMVKNGIANRNHLKEVVARNPELLEKGLKLVDTDIEIFKGDYADMLAVDGKNRLIVLAFSAEPQSPRSNKGIHLLKEAFHAWNWFTYFKESLSEETEKKTAVRLVDIPPRLVVVAPTFTPSLVNLAKRSARALIDLELYAYNKGELKAGDKLFQHISLKSDLPPAPLPDSIGSYHAQKMDEYWHKYGSEFAQARQGKGYVAYSLEDLLTAVGPDFKESFRKFALEILAFDPNLRSIFRKDRVIYKDIYGNEVCSLSVHELVGFSLLVGEKLFYWGEKPDKKKDLEEKTALAEIKSYAKILQEEVEKTL